MDSVSSNAKNREHGFRKSQKIKHNAYREKLCFLQAISKINGSNVLIVFRILDVLNLRYPRLSFNSGIILLYNRDNFCIFLPYSGVC